MLRRLVLLVLILAVCGAAPFWPAPAGAVETPAPVGLAPPRPAAPSQPDLTTGATVSTSTATATTVSSDTTSTSLTSATSATTATSTTTTSSSATTTESDTTITSRTTSTTQPAPAPAAKREGQAPAQADGGYFSAITGNRLRWVELSVGGLPVRVSAGGVVALHPDAPFRVLKMEGDGWLDYGLQPRLAGLPTADLGRFHTLNELMGEQVFERDALTLEIWRGQRRLGDIQLLVKLLPIDWLRRAEEAPRLADKIALTRKALDLTPDDRLLVLRLVDLLVEAGRLAEAAAQLEGEAWVQDDPTLLTRLADLYQRLDQPEKLAEVTAALLVKNPDDPVLLDRMATAYERQERWEEAVVLLERLSRNQAPAERAATFMRLAQAQRRLGRLDQAARYLQQATGLRPRDPALWQELAETRKQAGDQAGAIEAQRQAAELAPADQAARQQLAEDLAAAGKPAEAAAELEKLVQQSPGDSGLWLRLARLYEQVDDRPALVRVYQRLVRLGPHDPDLDYNLGVLLYDLGRWSEALDSLTAAGQARSQDREISELILACLLKLERKDQALDVARALLKGKPDQPALLERLYVALAKDRAQAVAKLLDQAMAAGSKAARLYELRAALALDQEDTATAVAALEAGAKALPANLELLAKLAGLYELAGREDKALKAYERILDKDPNFPGVQDRYLQLKTSRLGREPRKNGETGKQ
ncbi:MAG: tetratricopeptide repeat protein [Pseudomonadota bacterium]